MIVCGKEVITRLFSYQPYIKFLVDISPRLYLKLDILADMKTAM